MTPRHGTIPHHNNIMEYNVFLGQYFIIKINPLTYQTHNHITLHGAAPPRPVQDSFGKNQSNSSSSSCFVILRCKEFGFGRATVSLPGTSCHMSLFITKDKDRIDKRPQPDPHRLIVIKNVIKGKVRAPSLPLHATVVIQSSSGTGFILKYYISSIKSRQVISMYRKVNRILRKRKRVPYPSCQTNLYHANQLLLLFMLCSCCCKDIHSNSLSLRCRVNLIKILFSDYCDCQEEQIRKQEQEYTCEGDMHRPFYPVSISVRCNCP